MKLFSWLIGLLLAIGLSACGSSGGGGGVVTPSALTYSNTAPVYTVGVAISSDTPSSSGGAVSSYSISPALPAGLTLNTSTGVISGTPTAASVATSYTLTASNAGGSATVTLLITVADAVVAPSALSFSASAPVYTVGVAITANGPSISGGVVASYSVSPALPAGLTLNTSTGVISGTPTAASVATSYTVSASNAGGSTTATLLITVANAVVAPSALSYSASAPVYTVGVAITTNSPSSSGGTVTSYAVSPALPAGLSLNTVTGVISGTPSSASAATNYVVTASNAGGSATATLSVTVANAVVAPSALSYSASAPVYTVGVSITANTPTSSGGVVTSYSVNPALPAGLTLNIVTGVISGTPSIASAVTIYTVTASNAGGSTTASLSIRVASAVVAPSALSYSASAPVYTVGVAITANSPSSSGGTVTSYAVSPALPAGLSLNTVTGVITGTPSSASAAASYVVTASNAGGSTTATLSIRVASAVVAPSALSYSTSAPVYTAGVSITANSPSSSGGAVTSYAVSPALPAGLSLNTVTGVITGTPTSASVATNYTVTASNAGGSSTATLSITVAAAGGGLGGLNPAFGGGKGFVTHDGAAGGTGNDVGQIIRRDSSGRLLVAGYSTEANGAMDMALWRYNANGSLDTTFNGQGFLTDKGISWNGNAETVGLGLGIDSQGRIVVAGYSLTDTASGVWMTVVWRYLPDGTRDLSFNGVGIANYPIGQMQSAGTTLAIDASDRIVIGGFAWNGSSWDAMFCRYTADGFLDTSFAGVGYTVHNGAAGGNGEDMVQTLVLDGTGRIVATGGSANSAGHTDLVIWRYNTDGSLDTSFNGTGFVTREHDGGVHGQDTGHGVTLDASGRIVVSGWQPNAAGDDDFAIWRYNANGSIDTSFNGTGVLTQNGAAGGSGTDWGFGVAIDSAGRILASGTTANAAGDRDMAVWRFNANGTFDTSFGGKGWVTFGGSAGGTNGTDGSKAMLIDGAGHLVITGNSTNAAGNGDMTIWSLMP